MEVTQQFYQNAYDAAFNESGFGTRGDWQQGIQTTTAAVQGLAAGNVNAALAGVAAPYLAEVIRNQIMTKGAKGKDAVNVPANLDSAYGGGAGIGK